MQKLSHIQKICEATCLKVGREFKELKILAVSKFQSIERMRGVYQQGQRLFGENYLQEALKKQEGLRDCDMEWHFIGRIQRKKIKSICENFQLIHSVSSLEHLKLIDLFCKSAGRVSNVLLQVNTGHEVTKEGFQKEILIGEWSQIETLKNIQICGLMTMPPLMEDAENSRVYFRELFQLRSQLKELRNQSAHSLKELSMGTSHDYIYAIEEGATIVRLGTILFGERENTRN